MAFYYDKEKLPFDFTPQIFRYLESLIDIAEKTWADETDTEVSIINHFPGEPQSTETLINNNSFWRFLENMGGIKISEQKGPGMKVEVEIVKSGGIETVHPLKTYLRISDRGKIKKLLSDRNNDGVIRAQTLELIAKDIAERKTGPELIDLLKERGAPATIIVYPNTKWRMLFSAFRVLNTSSNQKVRRALYKVIEEAVHPLFFEGDETKAKETQEKYNGWLKYDRIQIKDGKLYIGPTEEALDLGINEWTDSDGKDVELVAYKVWSPKDIARLWVFWSQLIILVNAYENNKALDHKELEGLYLEIIGKVEEMVEWGKLDPLKETYARPFTSLATAHIEAKAKKAESPSDLVSAFLLKISALKPDATEISKEMKKSSKLIERIANATRVAGSEKKDLIDISAEEKWQGKSKKIIDALDEAIVRSLKNMSFAPNNQQIQQTVQKIEITAMPEVPVRFVGEAPNAKSKKRESPIELSFPEPVQWEKVTLKIKEGRQEIEIFYDNSHIITADYIQLRFFVGKRQQKPDRQWGFLCALSTLSASDFKYASAENMRPMITKNKTLSVNNVQQAKKLLVKWLKEIFKTNDEPFHDIHDRYKPKFAILPEPVLRKEEIWPQGGRFNENEAIEGGEEDDEEEAL